MQIQDWLMISATIISPIIAIQITRYLDNQKAITERKESIFKTLMATRAYTLSWRHVEALNNIDIEFSDNPTVISAWREYHDLLSDKNLSPEQWAIKRIDLLVNLLHCMATILKYDFDKTHIKKSSYSPIAHGEIDNQEDTIRKGLIELLNGTKAVPIKVLENTSS